MAHLARTLTVVLGLLLLAGGAGCGSGGGEEQGQLQVTVWLETSAAAITRVTVTLTPGPIIQDLVYAPATGAYTGLVTVPVRGDYVLTVEAYAGETRVAWGTTTGPVAVTRGGTSAVVLSLPEPNPTGSIDISATFVPHPRITRIELLEGVDELTGLSRDGPDATHGTPLARGTTYGIRMVFDPLPAGSTLGLANTCGGALAQPTGTLPGTQALGSWTPPATGDGPLCVVTATVTRPSPSGSLSDSFPVVFVLR